MHDSAGWAVVLKYEATRNIDPQCYARGQVAKHLPAQVCLL